MVVSHRPAVEARFRDVSRKRGQRGRSLRLTIARVTRISFSVRALLFAGVLRRWLLHTFRRGYVRSQLAARQGACARCGACCQMTWRCMFYHAPGDQPMCKSYTTCRLPNCINFPIDERDLADRDRVAPGSQCGYHWPRQPDHVRPIKRGPHASV